ncbi:MAG: PT domain-containing protein [Clostridia bacterium]|nr:PT domain-containing protein [Clostridia bacterium]
MKNLKRLFSLLLVVAMLLSSAVTSMAATGGFTDVKSSDRYAEAITLLSGLGIIQGYDDGKFYPESNITRAEAATIIVRTLGMDENVRKGNTIFSDVDSSHWASGYINIAVENGIINGFPDGTFHPSEYVTYEQIVKMVVCAIGHEPKAKDLGTYPQGYIRAASDAKVTKGISGLGANPAPRGLVAQLIYNALEVEMMDATSYSTGIFGTSYTYNGKTLLRDYLEIEKVDAIVTDTYLTGETFSSRDKYVELEITDVYTLNNRASRTLYDEGDVIEFDEGSFEDASNYLGRAIVAYVGEDRDTRKDTIFAIAVDDARNTEVEVTKERFYEKESNENVISYTKRVTDKRVTELELDRYAVVVVNGEIVSDSITEYFDTFDVMTLVDNDRDNEYDYIFVDVFDESEGVEFVVTDIEEDDGCYYFEGENGEIELDFEDDDVLIKIIKDGKEIEAYDIDLGDTITCLDTSRSILTVYVSSDVVKGVIDEVDYLEGEYYINEDPYELSPAFAEDLSAGDYGTFYLNYKGKIAYSTVASRVAGGDYIFVTNYDTQTKFSKTTYLVQAITEEGRVETYTLKSSKMKYVDHAGNIYKNVTPKTVYDYLTFNKTGLSSLYNVDGYVGLVRVKVSSAGVISEIYVPGGYEEFYEQTKYATENSREYSKKRGTYGNYDITGKEIAFRVDDAETDLTDAIEAGTVSDFFTDGDSYVFVAYGERNEDIEAVVITDGIASATYTDNAVIVTKVSDVRDGDEVTTKITGRKAGSIVTYIVDPDESYDVEVGNIILVSENAKGYVNKLEVVARTTDDADDLYNAFVGADIPSDEDVGVYAGMVTEKTSKRFEVEGIEDAFYNDSDVEYYLINYTGRTTEYTKGSFADIKLTSRIDTFVIVRTYEEEVVDVFIFRLNAEDGYDIPTMDIWDEIAPADPEQPTEPETDAPTDAPTSEPTDAPTSEPTNAPSNEPSSEPTNAPSNEPSSEPTNAPSNEPSSEATNAPSNEPSSEPTNAPSNEPSSEPTNDPSNEPSSEPTNAPSNEPSSEPTNAPSNEPSSEPTNAPSNEPSSEPTNAPSNEPSSEPTNAPSNEPSSEPTNDPSNEPTTQPTQPDGPVLAELTEKKVTVDNKLAEEVLKLINAERTKANLLALTLDKAVAKVSEAHGIDMATQKYLAQKNKAGADVVKRLTDAKVVFTAAAENLAQGNYTAQVIVDAWMKSDKHKVNILSADFTKVGISVAIATDGTKYWVVDFVK